MKNSKIKIRNQKSEIRNERGFSLVELLIVVVIIGVLSVVSFVAVQRARTRALNEKVLDDLIAISSALEDYQRDHRGKFPVPDPGEDQNVLCYRLDASYSHDCEAVTTIFRQGMIDNKLLTKRYLRDVPTDPRTGSRYIYGVTNDGKYFQVAGNYEREDGTYEARTVENIARGFALPSVIRAFDSPNFVIDEETYLPYSPNHLVLTATLENVNGYVKVGDTMVTNGDVVEAGQTINTKNPQGDPHGTTDIYFSDGSTTHVDPESNLTLKDMVVEKNDSEGTITKILLKVNAGKIWSKVVRLASESEFRVETTTAIAGVRGTEFGVDDTGAVKVKSGDVWKQDKDDMGLPPDPTGEEVFEQDEPADSDPVDDAIPADYKEYYETILLHSGMQPHVMSVGLGGEITVRNADYFVDQVDEDPDNNDPLDRHIQLTHLAIHDADFIDTETGEPALLYKVEVVPQGADFTFTLNSNYLNKSIILRFEDIESSIIIHQSGFSDPPITITDDTELIEGDIHEEEGAFELPILIVDAPEFMVINQLGEIVLTLEPSLDDGDTVYYVVDVVDSDPEICTAAEPQEDSETHIISSNVTGTAEGECVLDIGTTFNGDDLPPKQIIIQILGEETQQLFLDSPHFGAVIQEGKIEFQWIAENVPEETTFDLALERSFNGEDNFSPVSLINSYGLSDKSYTSVLGAITALPDPFYRWSVIMNDGLGNMETAGPWDFRVIGQDEAVASFTISITDSENKDVPPDPNNPLFFSVGSPGLLDVIFYATDVPDDFSYNWLSEDLAISPPEDQFPISIIDNIVEGMNPYNVNLKVKSPPNAENPDGLIVHEIAPTIEIEYVALQEITAIDFVVSDTDDTSVSSYDAVVNTEFVLNTFANEVYVKITGPPLLYYVNPDCVFSHDIADPVEDGWIDGGVYHVPVSPDMSDIIKCDLTDGATIQIDGTDYIVGPDVGASVTIVSTLGDPEAIEITGPTTVDLGEPPVAMTQNSGPPCDWTVEMGGGSIDIDTGMYNSLDGSEAFRFYNIATEDITIRCADKGQADNYGQYMFTVNYISKATSINAPYYEYSYFNMGGISWATPANNACATLTEGGVTAGTWHAPREADLVLLSQGELDAEKAYWCGTFTAECLEMPNVIYLWLEEELDVANAYIVQSWDEGVVSADNKNPVDNSTYGLRCVK